MASTTREVSGRTHDTVWYASKWYVTVTDVIVDGQTVGHITETTRPDGTRESREVTHCDPCHCWGDQS